MDIAKNRNGENINIHNMLKESSNEDDLQPLTQQTVDNLTPTSIRKIVSIYPPFGGVNYIRFQHQDDDKDGLIDKESMNVDTYINLVNIAHIADIFPNNLLMLINKYCYAKFDIEFKWIEYNNVNESYLIIYALLYDSYRNSNRLLVPANRKAFFELVENNPDLKRLFEVLNIEARKKKLHIKKNSKKELKVYSLSELDILLNPEIEQIKKIFSKNGSIEFSWIDYGSTDMIEKIYRIIF